MYGVRFRVWGRQVEIWGLKLRICLQFWFLRLVVTVQVQGSNYWSSSTSDARILLRM